MGQYCFDDHDMKARNCSRTVNLGRQEACIYLYELDLVPCPIIEADGFCKVQCDTAHADGVIFVVDLTDPHGHRHLARSVQMVEELYSPSFKLLVAHQPDPR